MEVQGCALTLDRLCKGTAYEASAPKLEVCVDGLGEVVSSLKKRNSLAKFTQDVAHFMFEPTLVTLRLVYSHISAQAVTLGGGELAVALGSALALARESLQEEKSVDFKDESTKVAMAETREYCIFCQEGLKLIYSPPDAGIDGASIAYTNVVHKLTYMIDAICDLEAGINFVDGSDKHKDHNASLIVAAEKVLSDLDAEILTSNTGLDPAGLEFIEKLVNLNIIPHVDAAKAQINAFRADFVENALEPVQDAHLQLTQVASGVMDGDWKEQTGIKNDSNIDQVLVAASLSIFSKGNKGLNRKLTDRLAALGNSVKKCKKVLSLIGAVSGMDEIMALSTATCHTAKVTQTELCLLNAIKESLKKGSDTVAIGADVTDELNIMVANDIQPGEIVKSILDEAQKLTI